MIKIKKRKKKKRYFELNDQPNNANNINIMETVGFFITLKDFPSFDASYGFFFYFIFFFTSFRNINLRLKNHEIFQKERHRKIKFTWDKIIPQIYISVEQNLLY